MHTNIAALVVLLLANSIEAFTTLPTRTSRQSSLPLSSTEDDLRDQAEKFLQRAKELRSTLPEEEESSVTSSTITTAEQKSKWQVPSSTNNGVGYRLELDIGREEGTWMDPRWGASGKRIECTLDVYFTDVPAPNELVQKMVQDNLSGASSPVGVLETATGARLRNGFDSMKCHGGAYRIDGGKTARFYIDVNGTPEKGSSYG